jgi:hypothetical protein
MSYVELRQAPVLPSATESFRTWREGRLQHLEFALALYAFGTATLIGLWAIAVKILSLWAELAVWIVSASTALGVRDFERPDILATTDPTYIFIMTRLPLGIAVVSALAAMTNLGLSLRRRNAGECGTDSH